MEASDDGAAALLLGEELRSASQESRWPVQAYPDAAKQRDECGNLPFQIGMTDQASVESIVALLQV